VILSKAIFPESFFRDFSRGETKKYPQVSTGIHAGAVCQGIHRYPPLLSFLKVPQGEMYPQVSTEVSTGIHRYPRVSPRRLLGNGFAWLKAGRKMCFLLQCGSTPFKKCVLYVKGARERQLL
jgi:hypothetical protein